MASVLQTIALIELVVCWVAWSMAFIIRPRKQATKQKEVALAKSSKWGILLVGMSFACMSPYLGRAYTHKPTVTLILSMILGPLSVALAWTATRHLGKQWRFQAGVYEGHELVQTGPYRWIRHPIYASMLGIMLAWGFCWTWWPLFAAGMVFFIAGTEVRIHAEERLLAAHFPESFPAYSARTKAYIPFVR